MATTIKEIAKKAGVSIGTVDRALNNRGRISAEVKKHILQIAKDLEYKPNLVAKSLATMKKELKIGFIIHVSHNEFHDIFIEGVKEAADTISDFGVDVIIREASDFSVEDQLKLIDELIDENISALALSPINDERIRNKLIELKEKGIPVVLSGGYIEEFDCLCCIGHDYVLQGNIAANLFDLFTEGTTEIIIFAPSFKMLGHVKLIESFSKCLLQEYPKLKIREIVELGNDEEVNYKIVEKVMLKNTDVNSIFFSTAVISGGLKAIEDVRGKDNTKIVSTFYSDTVRKAILKNQISAAVWYSPKEVSYKSITVLFEYLTSEKIPDNNRIDMEQHIYVKQVIRNQNIE